MAPLGWILAGLAVLVAILGLGLRLNRKKSTAHLALRLAEVYRLEGHHEVAKHLYDVAPRLDQNVEQAREGRRRAQRGITEPVLERALVEAARHRLRTEREAVAAHLTRQGIDVELPPLEADPGSGGSTG